jgi:hypothetical protein
MGKPSVNRSGICINDAEIELSPADLESLVRSQNTSVTLTKLDVSISPETLNRLLKGLSPVGRKPPSAAVSDGRLQVTAHPGGKNVALDFQVGTLRLELSADGIRLVSG